MKLAVGTHSAFGVARILKMSAADIEFHEEENESHNKLNLPSSRFFYWRDIFPECQILYDNIDIIRRESEAIGNWVPWPEDHFNLGDDVDNTRDWTVFPLLHTFPALDESKKSWIASTCALAPETTRMLKTIPNLRTALFSKLGPGTKLSSHTGWADLANYVLRCHLCLDIPRDGTSGLLVDGEIQYHKQGQIIVFDDSKPHRAFNMSQSFDRVVLIFDILRPEGMPIGTATGEHTPELENFVARFK